MAAKRGKPQARRQGGNSTPIWAWLLIGLFVGALIYFGYQQYSALTAPKTTDVALPQADTKKSDKSTEPPASGVDNGVLDTDYSFYDVLPTQETASVPADKDAASPAAPVKILPTDGKDTTTSISAANVPAPAKPSQEKLEDNTHLDSSRYLLQAGAFERNADADDLKARIALSGESARVEQAEVNGKTMYRVRLGPYPNAEAANAAKTNLAQQGIKVDSIKIKP